MRNLIKWHLVIRLNFMTQFRIIIGKILQIYMEGHMDDMKKCTNPEKGTMSLAN